MQVDERSFAKRSHRVLSEQLIGELLDGLSGRIIWGIVQIILTVLGDIGEFDDLIERV